MTEKTGPVMLIIRDGWGYSENGKAAMEAEGNTTLMADTPVADRLLANNPVCFLEPSGGSVGLPDGQMGNSEVGHLNLGAGRIVYQDFTRINKSIKDGEFFQLPTLMNVVDHVKANNSRLHLLGLVSDGGVHSHIQHIYACLELAKRNGISDVFIHCFMDGRDTSPTGGVEYLKELQAKIDELGVGVIASVCGRYYAMDRDNRWERTKLAYDTVAHGVADVKADAIAGLQECYDGGKTDEFIPPFVVKKENQQPGNQCLRDGDAVFYFNFRSDRGRQLTRAIVMDDFAGFDRGKKLDVHYATMTVYDETFGLPVAFPPMSHKNILAHVLADNNLKQLRVAETEKYPHVTFFFNGGIEEPVVGEDRQMVSSPKVATYDLQPEMSAGGVTQIIVDALDSKKYDVIILNYANPDMVGHTGSIPAATKAVETTDKCVGIILEKLAEVNGVALVTADHGNAEEMLTPQGKPQTAHTTNRVHCFYAGPDADSVQLKDGILADIAPTMLDVLGIKQPQEMTGSSMIERS